MNKINIILGASFIILAGCMTNIEDTNNQQASTGDNQASQTTESAQNTGTQNPGQETTQTNKTEVASGDTVKVDYIGTFESGDVFDTSLEQTAKESGLYSSGRQYAPLEFKVGQGQMIKGFDEGVIGMKIGETKKIKLAPEMGYGQPSDENIIYIPKSNLGTGDVTIGKTYVFNGPSGPVQGKILGFSGAQVQIDFNHPMAGKTLNFEITLKEIK